MNPENLQAFLQKVRCDPAIQARFQDAKCESCIVLRDRNQLINTVGAPGGMIVPVGLGIGATQAACVVISPTRAAGIFAMSTVGDP